MIWTRDHVWLPRSAVGECRVPRVQTRVVRGLRDLSPSCVPFTTCSEDAPGSHGPQEIRAVGEGGAMGTMMAVPTVSGA